MKNEIIVQQTIRARQVTGRQGKKLWRW